MHIEQGAILKVENVHFPLLVVSKNFFNQTGQALLCPIVKDTFEDPLHLPVDADHTCGLVMCEQIKLFDLQYRGWEKIDQISFRDLMNITDAIQSMFDYR
ncbi:MAG: type II toxin-antitoxin system PemK/MazF family toxin [Lachnospiraceae bacterium]|nr:type II toxin-antitoxin system PemK/MazF family toxin [Lachnospiraceae bacterium]